jgi:D-glycero-D-manno-heptose 1,7-bisphosphate phosphatase
MPAIFCDRDGTVVRDPGYVRQVDQVELLPGAAAGLSELRRNGFLLVIVSNQSGIRRQLVTEAEANRIDRRFQDLLDQHNAKPDAIYYCRHLPTDSCVCRKPAPGLLLRAARDLSIDLRSSWMIGDKQIDITAGRRAGCRTARFQAFRGASAWTELVSQILDRTANGRL